MSNTARLLIKILNDDLGVSDGYKHGPKQVTPGNFIETKDAILKWYAVHPSDRPVPDEVDRLARTYLERMPLEAKGLGFVILHRCGDDFYFLIVNTWRGNNEIWESVYYKSDANMSDFALWPRDGVHKPVFCVWELAPVWHEKIAWERFLISARDLNSAQIWQRDLYAGVA